jgi:hypothetical protein
MREYKRKDKMQLFGKKEMKHSEAYTDFKAQLKAVGRQRMEGYDPDLFDRITEQERSEVEKDVWIHFMNKNDADLAVLMPLLKNYDGIAALKKKLAEFKIPSYGSADIAFALFEATGEAKYLDIIMDNYRGLAVNTPIAAGLARLAKRPGVYALLVDIYQHDKDEANRGQAIVGLLWRDGKLNSVNDPMELFDKIDLIKAFKLDSEEAGNQ